MPVTRLFIKNMVCDRCKMAVTGVMKSVGLNPLSVDLGTAEVEGGITPEIKAEIKKRLSDLGFELLDDKRQRTIEQIKSAVIKLVHYNDNRSSVNLSDYLVGEIHQDYSSLSKLFSEVEGKTIEKYYIEQRIERVKELLRYDELTLSQIAVKMNYSSTAYLSSQFKNVTGMTPSQFKQLKQNTRKELDKV